MGFSNDDIVNCGDKENQSDYIQSYQEKNLKKLKKSKDITELNSSSIGFCQVEGVTIKGVEGGNKKPPKK